MLGFVALLTIVSGSGLSGVAGPAAVHPAVDVHPSLPGAPTAHPGATHGDLIVASGATYIIQPSLGGRTYYQGGNITVDAGGTLIVRNVTLSFVQFVADLGNAYSRLSHVVHFLDQGTVDIYNSTLTTDVGVLNAYPKLNVTVSGNLTVWNSTFAFPGWVSAIGASADVTFNQSTLTANPSIASLTELPVILGDSMFAPTLTASAGAKVNLFDSVLNDTYADNLQKNGVPGAAPLGADGVNLPGNVTSMTTPSDSANLTRDYLYPQGIAAGAVAVYYNTTSVATPSVYTVTVWYNGVGFPLASLTVANNTGNGETQVAFSAALVNAVNAGGILGYLNATGAFGGPTKIAINFGLTSGPGTAAAHPTFNLLPSLAYNVVATGGGTTFNAVDSSLQLTWNATPVSPWSTVQPYPWSSNKLLLHSGAVAYLANLSVSNPISSVFSTSAVLPDASSTAFFYRWAEVNLTGEGGQVPIYGAILSAYYAYSSAQANNATANSLNALATTDPAIWAYVQHKSSVLGDPAYGVSGRRGVAALLLASAELNQSTLPDGNFLGTYHIGVHVPVATIHDEWFNWSVSPYPVGVAAGSNGYAGPDYGPGQHFPQYFAGAAFASGSPVVLANGSAAVNRTVRIGQVLGLNTTIVSTGPAPITSLVAALYGGQNASKPWLLSEYTTTKLDLAQNQQYSFDLTWLVNDTVAGIVGSAIDQFNVVFSWNPGNVTGLSGVANDSLLVTIAPSQVHIISVSPPPTSVDLNGAYFSSGVLRYNGSQQATLELLATPLGGSGGSITIAVGRSLPGNFTLTWYPLSQLLSAGTTYTVTMVAVYNSVTSAPYQMGQVAVPSSTSPTGFLFSQFLGLPIWIWLAIAAGAVVAILAALLVVRRQAAGKLVECGECGNLIPEDASVCPKCGAEFETDLIRCSRCAATIPANSKLCPECSAQLLGAPGEAGEEAERQGYQDFTEKYRAEGKRELGDNFNEGSFWDWWKRQATYTSYSQWKLQQAQSAPRAGMSEPPAPGAGGSGGGAAAAPATAPPPRAPPRAATPPPAPRSAAAPPMAAPPSSPPAGAMAGPAGAAPAAGTGGMKPCPNCQKEIPSDYLVCPFCGSVTQ